MRMVWKCECGEEFEEVGNRKGYGQAFRHRLDTKHKIQGLYDAETDEVLVKGENLRNAIVKGFVKSKKAEEAEAEEKDVETQVRTKQKSTSPAKAIVKPEVVEIGPEIIVLHAVAKARFPDEYGNSSLDEFIEDCVMGFFTENAEVFGLERILGAC